MRIRKQSLVVHTCYISVIGRQRLEDQKFKTSLCTTDTLRLAWLKKSQPPQSSQIKGEHILQEGWGYHTEKGEAEGVGVVSLWRDWHLLGPWSAYVASSHEWWVTERPRAGGGKWGREQRMRGKGAACWGARGKSVRVGWLPDKEWASWRPAISLLGTFIPVWMDFCS